MDTSYCLAVDGFRTSYSKAGIKKSESAKGDLGLIVSDGSAECAAVFTKNLACAAPVLVSKTNLEQEHPVRAVLINSGNANACTGEQGKSNCRILASKLASLLCQDIEESNIFHASTGVIGKQLPVENILNALPGLVKNLDTSNGFGLAETIMTTDLVPKWNMVQGYINGKKITVSGIAKGSGMIAPDMATMLCFVLTDIAVDKELLQKMWAEVTDRTFNCITVDSDTSTNDTAVILANGKAGNILLKNENKDSCRFKSLLYAALHPLAKLIARDGEGATKLIKVEASGFGDNALCKQVARTIAESPLVKTALYGCDPNWGRIIAAAGRSGVGFNPPEVSIEISHVPVFVKGAPAEIDRQKLSDELRAEEVYITIHKPGKGYGYMYTCDYSYDYIRINAEYHT